MNVRSIRAFLKQKRDARRQFRRSRRLLNRIMSYDMQRLMRFSGPFCASEKSALAYAIGMEYHRIEKGISMPNRRLGFGQPIVLGLISLIRQYIEVGGKVSDFEAQHALKVIAEYNNIHRDFPEAIDESVKNAIANLLEEYPITPSQQIHMTQDEFWKHIHSDFALFSESRHSVRSIKGRVAVDDIIKAVSLACNAPSACNRQYVKVKLIDNEEKVQQVLALQNGNKGFGHRAEQLLMLSVDLYAIRWLAERNDIYTNAGIYAMNLCYSLHYHKIAHCLLNWSTESEPDMELRKIINIPDNETIVLLIIIGQLPEEFMLTASPRKNAQDILTIYKV